MRKKPRARKKARMRVETGAAAETLRYPRVTDHRCEKALSRRPPFAAALALVCRPEPLNLGMAKSAHGRLRCCGCSNPPIVEAPRPDSSRSCPRSTKQEDASPVPLFHGIADQCGALDREVSFEIMSTPAPEGDGHNTGPERLLRFISLLWHRRIKTRGISAGRVSYIGWDCKLYQLGRASIPPRTDVVDRNFLASSEHHIFWSFRQIWLE